MQGEFNVHAFRQAIRASNLPSTDRLVLHTLCSYPSAKEGNAFPSGHKLARHSGINRRTVTRSLARLTAAGGWLYKEERKSRGLKTSSILHLVTQNPEQSRMGHRVPLSKTPIISHGAQSPIRWGTESHNKETGIKREKEKEKRKPAVDSSVARAHALIESGPPAPTVDHLVVEMESGPTAIPSPSTPCSAPASGREDGILPSNEDKSNWGPRRPAVAKLSLLEQARAKVFPESTKPFEPLYWPDDSVPPMPPTSPMSAPEESTGVGVPKTDSNAIGGKPAALISPEVRRRKGWAKPPSFLWNLPRLSGPRKATQAHVVSQLTRAGYNRATIAEIGGHFWERVPRLVIDCAVVCAVLHTQATPHLCAAKFGLLLGDWREGKRNDQMDRIKGQNVSRATKQPTRVVYKDNPVSLRKRLLGLA